VKGSPTIRNVSDEHDATSLIVGRHDNDQWSIATRNAERRRM
jgi:hypothetical protein